MQCCSPVFITSRVAGVFAYHKFFASQFSCSVFTAPLLKKNVPVKYFLFSKHGSKCRHQYSEYSGCESVLLILQNLQVLQIIP